MVDKEGRTAAPFIGRARELGIVQAAVQEALAGRGRTVLLSGEPGIGKTRLATELGAYADRQRAQVLLGRCHEGEGAPPFWPWIQIVRGYVAGCEADTLCAEMGAGAADIAQVMPEVRERLPQLPTTAGLDSEQARFRFFDSLTTFLKTAARRQPLVLIFDDLHWADTPSLLLLQFVAREIADAPVLIVGTYRDLALGREHPLSQTIGDLVRTPGSQSVHLQGLSKADVSQFLTGIGLRPSAALVAAVHRGTEGNPFFLTEVVHLLETDAQPAMLSAPSLPFPIPQSVQAAIGRRLRPLSPDCQRVLQLAAVLGREFSFETLAAVGKQFAFTAHEDRLLDVLEEAAALRIITEVPGAVGRYSFSHALIRETLYEELSAVRRARAHQQIAAVLEQRYTSGSEGAPPPHASTLLAELAYHFSQAARGGQAIDKAMTYARQAGEHAMAVLAYEAAVTHFERALHDLALQGVGNDPRRGELLLALGEAQTRASAFPKAQETFQQVAVLARTLDARGAREQGARLLAQAALGFSEWVFIMADPPLIALLEEALALFGEEDSPLRAQVLSRLAAVLYQLPQETERRLALSRLAVDMARRLGETATLAKVLNSRRWVLWQPEYLSERLAVSREIVRLAGVTDAPEVALRGLLWLWADVTEAGDIAEAERILHTLEQLTVTLRQPFWHWWPPVFRARLALLRGHWAEAEQQIRRAWAIGQRVQLGFAVQYFWGHLLSVLQEQQRLPEVETDLRAFLTQFARVPGWRIAPVWLASELGQEAEARQGFAALAAQDFADLPTDGNWHGNMAALCEICLSLGDRPRAATLYALWQPYAGRNTIGGANAASCRGAVSRYLGALAALLSRWDEAEQHFHEALAMNLRMGARPWVAYTQSDYAGMLLARNQPGDQEKARELLDLALTTAQELGMPRLEEKVKSQSAKVKSQKEEIHVQGSTFKVQGEKSLESQNVQSSEYPAPSTQHPAPFPQSSNVFRRDGDYWTLVYDGQECRLKDAKGLHYLAALVHNPGRDFHVLDLLLLTDPPPAATAAEEQLSTSHRALRSADQSPHTDAQARAAYKSRLQEVQAELDDADRHHDLGRITALQAEIAFLTDELTAVYGFLRHARRASESHDQIRKNVTNRIRDTLRRLRITHSALGRHFGQALKTGTFCSYTPEHDVTWEG